MLATPRRSIRARTGIALLALPFAVIACGGDKSPNALAAAETKPATPVVPVSNVRTPTKSDPIVGSGVSTVPMYSSGDEAYKAGSYRDAAELYKVRVGSKPDDANGYYMLGLSSWKAGDFAGAKEAFDRSIELNPKFAKSYFNGARVLLDLKRAPEALELIEKGRTIDSTSPDGLRLKARAQSEGGDIDDAISTYRELLVGNDADTWGLNNLGVLLLNRGEFEDALGPLARVVQVQPTAPLFQNNFGMALERSGHKTAALRHYELAVQHDSTFAKALKNAERLRGIVTDTVVTGEASVEELAEEFRLKVKAWKEAMKDEVKPVQP